MSNASLQSLPDNYIVYLLIALFLFGLLLGMKLPIRRRKKAAAADPRSSTDYILGMYAMLTGAVDSAIEHLSKVVEISTDPVEVYLALGNLFRQRGQIDRAIRVHQSLLARSGLSEQERVLALSALGSDYRTGGFMDRALVTYKDALALDPKDTFALTQLVKLSEDLGEWDEAYGYAVRLQKLRRYRDTKALSYLLAQRAKRLSEDSESLFKPAWLLRKAIRLLPENMLAHIYLAKLYLKADRAPKARRILEKSLKEQPYKSYMVMDLLKEIYLKMDDGQGYLKILSRLAGEYHQKRALLQYLQECLDLKQLEKIPEIVRALVTHFGRSRLVQRKLWDMIHEKLLPQELVLEISEVLGQSGHMNDHYTCIYCGYKTLEVLHRCPNCKEWNSFADGEN